MFKFANYGGSAQGLLVAILRPRDGTADTRADLLIVTALAAGTISQIEQVRLGLPGFGPDFLFFSKKIVKISQN